MRIASTATALRRLKTSDAFRWCCCFSSTTPPPPPPAEPRLPVTHSSYLPGLLRVLRRVQTRLGELAEHETGAPSPVVRTIIPGRISKTRGHKAGFSLQLTTTPQAPNYYKALARKGSTVQEVFFVGGSREQIEAAISSETGTRRRRAGKEDHGPPPRGGTGSTADDARTVAFIKALRRSGEIR